MTAGVAFEPPILLNFFPPIKQSMELIDAILGRRSVRDYEPKIVPEEAIGEIIKAGAMAPSARDAQPCRFIIIENRQRMLEIGEKVKQKLYSLGMGAKLAERAKVKLDVIFYGAPLLILVVAEKNNFSETDCALAAQNMMLRAYDLGLGSCFIGLMNSIREDREYMRTLGIKGNQELYCPLIFGYPRKFPEPIEREAKIQSRMK